jgi:hypothetical protein
MRIQAADFSQDLLATATSGGSCQVASSAGFYVGAEAWLFGALGQLQVRVMKVPDTTHVVLRAFKDPDDGSGALDLHLWVRTYAQLNLRTALDAHGNILQAATIGNTGNLIKVVLVGDSAPAGNVTINETGNVLTIHYEDGVSTWGDVDTALGAATLVTVSTASASAASTLNSPADNGSFFLTGGGPRLSQPAQLVRVEKKVVKSTRVF